MKKGVYKPLTDFNFQFIMKVIPDKPANTGYLVKVIPESTMETDGERNQGTVCIHIINLFIECTGR